MESSEFGPDPEGVINSKIDLPVLAFDDLFSEVVDGDILALMRRFRGKWLEQAVLNYRYIPKQQLRARSVYIVFKCMQANVSLPYPDLTAFRGKGKWSELEDSVLTEFIAIHGLEHIRYVKDFTGLSRGVQNCKSRWVNYLDPSINKEPFSKEEDNMLLNITWDSLPIGGRVKQTRWSELAKKEFERFHRSPYQLQNRYHQLEGKKRRQATREEELERQRRRQMRSTSPLSDSDAENQGNAAGQQSPNLDPAAETTPSPNDVVTRKRPSADAPSCSCAHSAPIKAHAESPLSPPAASPLPSPVAQPPVQAQGLLKPVSTPLLGRQVGAHTEVTDMRCLKRRRLIQLNIPVEDVRRKRGRPPGPSKPRPSKPRPLKKLPEVPKKGWTAGPEASVREREARSSFEQVRPGQRLVPVPGASNPGWVWPGVVAGRKVQVREVERVNQVNQVGCQIVYRGQLYDQELLPTVDEEELQTEMVNGSHSVKDSLLTPGTLVRSRGGQVYLVQSAAEVLGSQGQPGGLQGTGIEMGWPAWVQSGTEGTAGAVLRGPARVGKLSTPQGLAEVMQRLGEQEDSVVLVGQGILPESGLGWGVNEGQGLEEVLFRRGQMQLEDSLEVMDGFVLRYPVLHEHEEAGQQESDRVGLESQLQVKESQPQGGPSQSAHSGGSSMDWLATRATSKIPCTAELGTTDNLPAFTRPELRSVAPAEEHEVQSPLVPAYRPNDDSEGLWVKLPSMRLPQLSPPREEPEASRNIPAGLGGQEGGEDLQEASQNLPSLQTTCQELPLHLPGVRSLSDREEAPQNLPEAPGNRMEASPVEHILPPKRLPLPPAWNIPTALTGNLLGSSLLMSSHCPSVSASLPQQPMASGQLAARSVGPSSTMFTSTPNPSPFLGGFSGRIPFFSHHLNPVPQTPSHPLMPAGITPVHLSGTPVDHLGLSARAGSGFRLCRPSPVSQSWGSTLASLTPGTMSAFSTPKSGVMPLTTNLLKTPGTGAEVGMKRGRKAQEEGVDVEKEGGKKVGKRMKS